MSKRAVIRKFKNTKNAIKHTLLNDYGILVTLDGLNNMGQDQVMRQCKSIFAQKNVPTVFVTEPTCTKTNQIQDTIKNRKHDMENIITPALKQHKLVICNHFVLDDMAYLGNYQVVNNPHWFWTDWSSGHPNERVHQKMCDLNHILKRNQTDINWGKKEPDWMYKARYDVPDLCLFFDAYPYNHKTLKLINKRSHTNMSFKQFIYLENTYGFALQQYQHSFLTLDCTQPIQDITKSVVKSIYDMLHNCTDAQWPFSLNHRIYPTL